MYLCELCRFSRQLCDHRKLGYVCLDTGILTKEAQPQLIPQRIPKEGRVQDMEKCSLDAHLKSA